MFFLLAGREAKGEIRLTNCHLAIQAHFLFIKNRDNNRKLIFPKILPINGFPLGKIPKMLW